MTRTETEELAARYAAAWASRDPDAIAALHTEDGVFHLHSAGSEPARGREAVRDAFAGILALIPDLGYAPVSLRVGDDHWVAEWRIVGTSAQGGRVEADLIDVVEVRDGLVHSKQSYADALTLQAQLGLSEVPA